MLRWIISTVVRWCGLELNIRALPKRDGKRYGWFGNFASRYRLYNWTLTRAGLRWRRLV